MLRNEHSLHYRGAIHRQAGGWVINLTDSEIDEMSPVEMQSVRDEIDFWDRRWGEG